MKGTQRKSAVMSTCKNTRPENRLRQVQENCASVFRRVALAAGRVPAWAWLLLFAATWLGLRLPWLASDGGVASCWEYGTLVTDEGYYVDGGKEKFLFGKFVDLTRHEAFTFGYSPLTHVLSYLTHLVFGLSDWKWRIPFVLINFGAWLALFRWCAARGGAGAAFLLCVAVSSSPLVLMYERTSSNDVLIGSLLVLSFCAACSRRLAGLVLSAALFALVAGVKPSVYALAPIVLAGVLAQQKTKRLWLDAAIFCALTAVGILCVKWGARALVAPDAAAQGVTAAEIVRRTITHYPFPNILNFGDHFKGLASFPRQPGGLLLGPLALFAVPLPLAMLLARLSDFTRRPYLDWRVLLYAALPAYVGAVAVLNTTYTHYCLPIIIIIPVLCIAAWDDCKAFEPAIHRRGSLLCAALLCAATFAFVRLLPYDANPAQTAPFFSIQYNLPQKLPWAFSWKHCVCFAVLGSAAVCAFGWRNRAWWWRCAAVVVAMLVLVSVVWSQMPAAVLAPYMKMKADDFILNMALCAGAGLAMLFVVFAFPGRAGIWKVAPLLVVCLFYAASPKWRTAGAELLRKGTTLQATAAAELAPLLPPGAIVLGERSNQVLMSLPAKPATMFASNADPIPIIKRVLEAEPDAPLFALIDPHHSYCMQHYEKNKDWLTLVPVKQVMLPSFGDGRPVPVTLCRCRIQIKQ